MGEGLARLRSVLDQSLPQRHQLACRLVILFYPFDVEQCLGLTRKRLLLPIGLPGGRVVMHQRRLVASWEC